MTLMKKCLIPLFLMIALSLSCLLLPSCDSPGSVSVEGIYYEYSNDEGALNHAKWIRLHEGEWNDSEGREGTYEFSGEAIVLNTLKDEVEEEYASGSVGGGELKFEARGVELVYHIEE